jgi:hypothetical protein
MHINISRSPFNLRGPTTASGPAALRKFYFNNQGEEDHRVRPPSCQEKLGTDHAAEGSLCRAESNGQYIQDP